MSEPRELPLELEDRLVRYRAGAMSAEQRAAFEREALGDELLAEELYREVSLDVVNAGAENDRPAAAVARPAARRTPWIQRSRAARIWLPVAASALVVVGLTIWRGQSRRPFPGGGGGLRGGVPTLALLEPVGPIAAPPRQFRWTRDSGAASYRVELFDPDAKRIGVTVTSDTTLAIELLTKEPISAGQWRVVPLSADGLELPRHVRAVFVVAR